jgi:hypothetical protein
VAGLLLLGGYIVWFLVGGEYNRRRAGRLAQWIYRGLTPLLGKASIRWLTAHAFDMFVEDAHRPFSALKITGLLESRDMVAVWLYNRMTYRPDLVVLRANLQRTPACGFEAFRTRTILAGDACQAAKQEGWVRQETAHGLELWHAGGKAGVLCRQLVDVARGLEQDVIRLAVHGQEPHLVLAISAARFERQDPQRLFACFRQMAQIAEAYARSASSAPSG